MVDQEGERLQRWDYAILAAFCLLFFSYSFYGGRPLSMHEAVLPETSREMLADRDWIVPKNGGRPWLESPPLPQWITTSIGMAVGRLDEVWIARIGPALMGTISVLLVGWMGSVFFGRVAGLLSGLVLATMYEFAQYSWLSEDEIFLCALVTAAVAAFVRLEFALPPELRETRSHFLGKRNWGILLLFVALGATNLAKGLLFGTAMALIPIAGYLLWNRDWKRIAPYFWLWGWVAFVAIAVAWPIAAWFRYPNVWELWSYDHAGRLDGTYDDITQPVWYYLKSLPGEIAPWTPVALLGLWLTRTRAWTARYSAERFLWCWALLTPAVFSIPSGKHHHYLLHCLAPWAILSAPALLKIREWLLTQPFQVKRFVTTLLCISIPAGIAVWCLQSKIEGPPVLIPALIVMVPVLVCLFSWGLPHRNGWVAGGTLFSIVGLLFCAGHTYAGLYKDQCTPDTRFLQQVQARMQPDQPVYINGDLQTTMEAFRILFYLHGNTPVLHNLTFLADERIRTDEVEVIGRYSDIEKLQRYGSTSVVLQSTRSRREKSPADRLTLFRLRFRHDLARLPGENLHVSPMQTMGRADGPFLIRR